MAMMTGAEYVQKNLLLGNDLTERYAQKLGEIDWERRTAAESSPAAWFNTYCVEVIADRPVDGHLPDALAEMYAALTMGRPYQIIMARGFGKTTLAEGVIAMACALGIRHYVCLIGANLDTGKSLLDDIFRVYTSDAFVQDYPHIGYPLSYGLETSYKRRFTVDGGACECNKNANELILPTITIGDDEMSPASGTILKAFGFGAAIRGKKRGALRPDLVLLDDIQTDEDAANPATVSKSLDIIRKSVLNLGGKDKISVLSTATIIAPDDLPSRLKEDRAWKTTEYPAFVSFPNDYTNGGGLWEDYYNLFDAENRADKPHDESRAFYAAHRAAMDAGADTISNNNYSAGSGHLSVVQKLMDRLHEIGRPAFMAEMQMRPVEADVGLKIKPRDVIKSESADVEKLAIPAGYTIVYAATDLNLSYALTTVIKAYKPDSSRAVIFHETYPCNISLKLTDAEYYAQVYQLLTDYGKRLKEICDDHALSISGWGIDCNGIPFDAVNDWCKSSSAICGIPAIGMRGSQSVRWNPTPRSAISAAINDVVLVGDAAELARGGAGRKWLSWSADRYRENVHLSILSPIGARGSESLYHAKSGEDIKARDEFAQQICNETLLYKTQLCNGRIDYRWRTREPHDYLDASAMADAIAGFRGIGAASASNDIKRANVGRTIRASVRRSSVCL